MQAQKSKRLSQDDKTWFSLEGETFYRIHHLQNMEAFFMNIVSESDLWMFLASNGALTAGRINSDHALFPYITEDRIYDSSGITGPKTLIRFEHQGKTCLWLPFREPLLDKSEVDRSISKNISGNKVLFQETHIASGLSFSYMWSNCDKFGFVRKTWLENKTNGELQIEILDGIINLLPAHSETLIQQNFSCLLDAYKQNQLDSKTGTGIYALASQLVDRAEPKEALKASMVWSLRDGDFQVSIDPKNEKRFVENLEFNRNSEVRAVRGAYWLDKQAALKAGESWEWTMVCDTNLIQSEVSTILEKLESPKALQSELEKALVESSEKLKKIVERTDGLQVTGDREGSAHHFANTLFNDMRGGVYHDGTTIQRDDFIDFVKSWNKDIFEKYNTDLQALESSLDQNELKSWAESKKDKDLLRLSLEYLPLTFSRRHGDPSRPWNKFNIKIRDEAGKALLNYQGNWRDIFQNWESLSLSYPVFIENIIAKFLNATTIDGFNPYRIMRDGIDWEEPNPDDPWAGIGYWGDHQIIYLLKLLEHQKNFFPESFNRYLSEEIFVYSRVPYELKNYQEILDNPRESIRFRNDWNTESKERAEKIGADGKLLYGPDKKLIRSTMLEKLLIPWLSKMSNFVPNGGIWMNTQRPEWNDANNALVGYGISMVTLYYLERYTSFLLKTLKDYEASNTVFHTETIQWMSAITDCLDKNKALMEKDVLSPAGRAVIIKGLGEVFEAYRNKAYQADLGEVKLVQTQTIVQTLETAQSWLRHSIKSAKPGDELYQAYNLLKPVEEGFEVEFLYDMLEGQVAALSATDIDSEDVLATLEALPESSLYRKDQHSYTLYPNKKLPSFLNKNKPSAKSIERIPMLKKMISSGDERILLSDPDGTARFRSEFYSAEPLQAVLNTLQEEGLINASDYKAILELYEESFNHRAFTGRSGSMFAFEGLGSIYWHMVSKLLLASQEQFFRIADEASDPSVIEKLKEKYYDIRKGIGFNKSPEVYGAFPLDPYSHTPAHAGAKQPGMTGQVKEEIITRFGELGLRVRNGKIFFDTRLLRESEFLTDSTVFRPLGLNDERETIELEAGELAYTYCQVPIVYKRGNENHLCLKLINGEETHFTELEIDSENSASVFERSQKIRKIIVTLKM